MLIDIEIQITDTTAGRPLFLTAAAPSPGESLEVAESKSPNMCLKMLTGDYCSNKFCFGKQFTGIVSLLCEALSAKTGNLTI